MLDKYLKWAVVCMIAVPGIGLSGGHPLPLTGMRRFSVALREENSPEWIGCMQVERVFTDHEKRGFFKIGLLPRLVVSGMSIECRRPEKLSVILDMISATVSKLDTSRSVEFRDVTILLNGCGVQFVKAGRLVGEQPGVWILSGGVSWGDSVNLTGSARALLRWDGHIIELVPDDEQIRKIELCCIGVH